MKRSFIVVAVDTEGKVWAGHFGVAPYYYCYDFNGKLLKEVVNPYGPLGGQHKHHDNPLLIVELLPEAAVFIGRGFGGKSKQALAEAHSIRPVSAAEKLPDAAVQSYLSAVNENKN